MSDEHGVSVTGRPDDPYPGRRQADDLLPEELRATPAWWFPPFDGRLSGPDPCTVLPIDSSGAAADGTVEFPDGRFLLAAKFTLADGSVLDGHVTYAAGETVTFESQEPTIATDRGQVPLWRGALHPSGAEIAQWLAALGRTRDAVFPLVWRASLHPAGTDLAGGAAGFAVWRAGRIEFV